MAYSISSEVNNGVKKSQQVRRLLRKLFPESIAEISKSKNTVPLTGCISRARSVGLAYSPVELR